MKISSLIILSVLLINNLFAQSYQINFAGSGASSSVDSVRVQNLTQCIDTVFAGNNILNLTSLTAIENNESFAYNNLKVYPNPSGGIYTLDLNTKNQSNAIVSIYDVCGRLILKGAFYIQAGNNSFSLTGLKCGVYFVKAEIEKDSYNYKLISNGLNGSVPQLKHSAFNDNKNSTNNFPVRRRVPYSKSINSLINMPYHSGDLLKISGKSGIYRTVKMLTPTQSQTVTFNFVACSDASGNDYSVVQIGTQLWMAENLKSTKYRNGVSIPNIPDSLTWVNTSTGAYCDYHNLTSEGQQYGHLYNWFACNDPQNIAPLGWHVASDSEWTVLTGFLGGDGIAGQKLKSNCNTRWAYLDTAWGSDLVGFTALCANYRNAVGGWSTAPNNDHDCWFWTSTPGAGPNQGYANGLRWLYRDVFRTPGFIFKKQGCSLRCIHN
jgi:uncharacterized protein (TIGR02145 family)